MTGSQSLIMGVINLTPDSFSDGGAWDVPDAAVQHGRELVDAGADLLDIGAESTRPGFQPVTPPAQIARLLPVIEGLAGCGVPLSVDTTSAAVAQAALAAGATIVNDVSGGMSDPEMLPLIASSGADYVCQWWTNWPNHEIIASRRSAWLSAADELRWRRDNCLKAGVVSGQIILDPGLGFGKSLDDNWRILAHIDEITGLGQRVLIGASRKSFLDVAATPLQREGAGVAISIWCAQHKIWAVRVHDVKLHRQAVYATSKLSSMSGSGDQNTEVDP